MHVSSSSLPGLVLSLCQLGGRLGPLGLRRGHISFRYIKAHWPKFLGLLLLKQLRGGLKVIEALRSQTTFASHPEKPRGVIKKCSSHSPILTLSFSLSNLIFSQFSVSKNNKKSSLLSRQSWSESSDEDSKFLLFNLCESVPFEFWVSIFRIYLRIEKP